MDVLYYCNIVIVDEIGPKMFLLFSHLINEKIASFLTYLKSWRRVVLVFGKEHANQANNECILHIFKTLGTTLALSFSLIWSINHFYIILNSPDQFEPRSALKPLVSWPLKNQTFRGCCGYFFDLELLYC